MKTMKLNEEIIRVSDNEAEKYAKIGYSYIKKSEWKEKVRDPQRKSSTKEEKSEKKKGNPKGKAKKEEIS